MTDPGVGTLPPEINSALVHSGAGPAPTLDAAMAFAAAAVQNEANAQQILAILNAVRSQWEGQAAEQHAAQLMPLIEWYQSLAANATASQEQIALAAQAISAAILEAPFPAVVTENRTTWGVLNATNFFGVNTPAINVQDAHYLEMWFQAAFARATSDVEHTMASGSLVPQPPPTVPVNPGMVGAPTAHAMTSSLRVPLAGMDGVINAANEASLDGLAVEGAAGDVAYTVQQGRPNSALVASAADNRGDEAQQQANNPLGQLGGEQASQLGGQTTGMLSSAGQLPAQMAQQVTQPLQQVAQVPAQASSQFSSMLSPLMQSSNFATPTLSGAENSLMPASFATGSGGGLAAALTRPASVAGGGGGGILSSSGSNGVGGLRLPASSLTTGAAPSAAAGGGPGGTGTGATPAGTGMYGAPMHGGQDRSGSGGSENQYAATTRLGPQDEVGDDIAS